MSKFNMHEQSSIHNSECLFFLSTNNHWYEEIYLFREDQTFAVNICRFTRKLNLIVKSALICCDQLTLTLYMQTAFL